MAETRPRRHPFRSSFWLLPKWLKFQELKSKKQFLFRNPKSREAKSSDSTSDFKKEIGQIFRLLPRASTENGGKFDISNL